MSLLRTEKQVAFNNLLVAVVETMDDYEDFADVIDDPQIAEKFRTFMQERKTLAAQLETVIRQLDDLPSPPDADKEDLGKLVHRIRAALFENEIPRALNELIDDEQQMLELAQSCRHQGLNATEEHVVAQ